MRLFSLLIVSLISGSAIAAEPEVPNCAPDGVAVGGYDLVSYHLDSGPVAGDAQFEVEHGALRYRFANREHQDRFLANPDNYLPVYRGWCAATLSFGKLACPEYTNFKLEDGKLLLFEHNGFTNGRTVWDSDPLGHRQRADQHFVQLVP